MRRLAPGRIVAPPDLNVRAAGGRAASLQMFGAACIDSNTNARVETL